MKTSRFLAAAAGAALLASLVAAPSASAEDTTTTFTVAAGSLTISLSSATAELGTATASALGSSVTGKISDTTISDQRASTLGWTVSAKMANDFYKVDDAGVMIDANNDSVADTTFAKGNAKITTAAASATSGTVVFTPELVGKNMTTADQTIGSATATGSNSVTFPTTVTITIPSTTLAGNYKGVITQTVA